VEFRTGSTRIGVNIASAAALEEAVLKRFSTRDGFALATINLDHLVKLSSSARFRDAYGAQDLVCADGNPIVWLSRLAGRPVELVPGSDMVLPLVRLAARSQVPIALLGSTAETLDRTAAELTRLVPGLIVAERIAPPFGFDPDGPDAEEMLRSLADRDVGLCLLALGAPKQEVLAARGRTLAPRTGFASIGAGLDFIAGSQNRAPAWVRRIAMEWAWRMLTNPRRLVLRYLRCFLILPGLVAQALVLRFSRRAP